MNQGAHFSDCGKYRYVLWRIWDENLKVALCIGLNPSTANVDKNDNTINMLIGMLKQLGYGGFKIVNLYAYITSKPPELASVADPLKDNDTYVLGAAYACQEIIFCWGNFKSIEYRAKKMIEMFPDALCFGKNQNGSPWHPRKMCYIKGFTYEKAVLNKFK